MADEPKHPTPEAMIRQTDAYCRRLDALHALEAIGIHVESIHDPRITQWIKQHPADSPTHPAA